MLINVLKSTDFANTAYKTVKNRHFSANIVLCAENVSENEKSGKAEYSYFVPALWHLLLSPPLTPIVYLPRFLSCTSFYRRLISLFLPRTSSAFSGAPQRTHPVGAGVCPSVCPAVAPFSHPVGAGVLDGPHRRTFEYRCTLVYPSVGAGVPDGPLLVPFMPPGGIFRAPSAGHFWPQPQK